MLRLIEISREIYNKYIANLHDTLVSILIVIKYSGFSPFASMCIGGILIYQFFLSNRYLVVKS